MRIRLRFASIAAFAGAAALSGCGLSLDNGGIDYAMDPQEFAHDFGMPVAATFPSVDCSQNAMLCASVPKPDGFVTSCAAGKCAASYDLVLFQTINLSQQKSFPPLVTNSSVVQQVQVGAIHYWTTVNSLNVATPAIGIYVGPQTAQKASDPGVTKLGEIPSLPAGQKTVCRSGTPGTEASACDIPLTDDGKNALGMFARDFRMPFSIIVSTTLSIKADEPVPAGKVDVFVQPVLKFVL